MWYCDLKFLVKFKIDALVWKIFFFFRYSCCFVLKNYLCYFAWLIADPFLFKSSHRSCSVRNGVKNFSKFTGKRLCQGLCVLQKPCRQWSIVFSTNLEQHSVRWISSWTNQFYENTYLPQYGIFPSLPSGHYPAVTQRAFTCSKLKMETPEQGMKYAQN